MKYKNRIELLSMADIGFNTPLIPFLSMEKATAEVERFFNNDKPKGLFLISGAVGVGKTHFLRAWARSFNFQTGSVYVANFHPTDEWLNFDFSNYKEKVLVFVFSEEALLRQREYTIALWKKLLVLDIAIMAEVPSSIDTSSLAIEFGTLLTIANISLPTKRDLALFAVCYYSQRIPSGQPYLDIEYFRALVSKAKSIRVIQSAILHEKLLHERDN